MLHSLAPKYIDTGKVQVKFKQFAYIGPESTYAAEASECANEQGRFWEYAAQVFARQAGENRGAFSKSNLKAFALQISGLDSAAFNVCFDNGKFASRVRDETAEGQRLGVRATPSFFVNGQFMEGLPPDAQFAALLDSLLLKK